MLLMTKSPALFVGWKLTQVFWKFITFTFQLQPHSGDEIYSIQTGTTGSTYAVDIHISKNDTTAIARTGSVDGYPIRAVTIF